MKAMLGRREHPAVHPLRTGGGETESEPHQAWMEEGRKAKGPSGGRPLSEDLICFSRREAREQGGSKGRGSRSGR